MTDHLKRVTDAFARQAETFAASAAINDKQIVQRIVDAAGDAGEGRILDLACGPGIVTAALAERAAAVVAFDATPEMLMKARERCDKAGLSNVVFERGDAEVLPFEDGSFDTVATRLAIHHFVDPRRVIGETFRVLKPGGRMVVADVIVSEEVSEAALQNAIEILRDPSHVRMLSESELLGAIRDAGFAILSEDGWDKAREFEEWMGIVNDPQRVGPLRTIARALAEAGRRAGMGLSVADGKIVFFHRWRLIAAEKPGAHGARPL